jgi:penicillin-binding protein 1B
MNELKMIDKEQADQAKSVPLPNRPEHSLTEPAPYFVQSVRRELASKGLDESEGLRVYTTLNLRAQEAAHQAVRAGLERIEKTYPHIQKLKASGKNLEAVLLSSDPATGAIEALVGGRGFLATQFNRATDSRRQVGSVMKPFVFLTAFEALQKDGQPYTPLTILKDEATTHKFEGQTWTPGNYDGTYNGDVPLFWALKESLNAATVNLGMSVGLTNIIDTARRLGISSTIKPLPSLTLGAFELSPIEVLQAYGALARMGMKVDKRLVHRIENLSRKELFVAEPVAQRVVSAEPVAELVGAMKQTLISGTGRGARAAGFTHPAAGKTGTTNDKKDAWFAGFTPYHSAIVWVGYDDNTSHNLTGASGAVPIWTTYMKAYASQFPAEDFKWPDGSVEKVTLSPEQQTAFGVPSKNSVKLEPIELVFKRGQAPRVPAPSDSTAKIQ